MSGFIRYTVDSVIDSGNGIVKGPPGSAGSVSANPHRRTWEQIIANTETFELERWHLSNMRRNIWYDKELRELDAKVCAEMSNRR
jgi:hypothetical protein